MFLAWIAVTMLDAESLRSRNCPFLFLQATSSSTCKQQLPVNRLRPVTNGAAGEWLTFPGSTPNSYAPAKSRY